MPNEPVVLFSSAQGIATVTLNRPEKCNALNDQLVKELISIFKKIQKDDSRVVILQGNGDHFCAGADIGWMQTIAKSSPAENLRDAKQLASLLHQIYSFPKPLIVVAQGTVLGGGLGLIAVGDIAIASKQTSFAFSEIKLGISPSVVSPYVIAAMGERKARYYFLTGSRFDADEAQQSGLVHQVVEADALKSASLAIANQLLKYSSEVLTASKRLTQEVGSQKISKKLIEYTAKHLVARRKSAEAKEGLAAFLEKRPPEWL